MSWLRRIMTVVVFTTELTPLQRRILRLLATPAAYDS